MESVSLLGLIMPLRGGGQGERVSQMLESRIPLAAERKPSTPSEATSPLRKYSVICEALRSPRV
jgi:hypothetical protein